MINKAHVQNIMLLFERSYRPFLQGLRIALAVLIIILIYLFFQKDSAYISISICVIGLMPAYLGTPQWSPEFNMIFSYLITTAGIFLASLFSQTFTGVCIYSFLLAFTIYIFAYYKLNTIYSLFGYIIPAYAIVLLKTFSETLIFAAMNTVSLVICLFICTVLIRPNLPRECLYEMRATLRELMFFIDVGENFILHPDMESRKTADKHREESFLRIQNLRLIIAEIHLFLKTNKNTPNEKYQTYFTYYLLALQQESFAELTVSLMANMRNLPFHIQDKDFQNSLRTHTKSIFNELTHINSSLLKFITKNKKFTLDDVQECYEKMYEHIAEKFEIFLQKYLTEQYNSQNKDLEKVYQTFLQFKDNMMLLNSRLKYLAKQPPGSEVVK